MDADEDIPIFCHRCAAQLTPGEGNFYVVRILAVADPYPPHFDDEDLQRDIEAEVDELLAEMHDMDEQELADQVFRRLTIHLCSKCYADWIENPAG